MTYFGSPDLDPSGRRSAHEVMTERAPSWRDDAACRDADPDLFFPERGQDVGPALAYCAVCPVREECLNFAITNRERWGIWGGLSGRRLREALRHIPNICVCEFCGRSFVGPRYQTCCDSLECHRARANGWKRKRGASA